MTDQKLAEFGDRMPTLWGRMFNNLLEQKFTRQEALLILTTFIAASHSTK
jgi:hypothetical protein